MGTTDNFDSLPFYEYRRRGVHLQEELFGKTFVCVGGKEFTSRICKDLLPKCGQKVGTHSLHYNVIFFQYRITQKSYVILHMPFISLFKSRCWMLDVAQEAARSTWLAIMVVKFSELTHLRP